MKNFPGLTKTASRIFFGTANPPVSDDEETAYDLLDSVLASGVNAFDCARSYGRAEEMLGKWIESRKCREKVIILSKCGDVKAGKVSVNRHVIIEQLNQSLESLRADLEEGKIKIFVVSNWTHQRIEKANNYAESKGLAGFQVSSPNYGLALQVHDLWGGGCVSISGDKAACSWYAENQMPVIAYSSLGRGLFSGKFSAEDSAYLES